VTRALVIGRRRKGRGIPAIVADVELRLRTGGWTVTSRVVSRKRQLRRHARRAVDGGLDVVVAVGGDGAVQQVATALEGSSTALGILPTGTGNLLAGNLHVPVDRDEALDTILNGRLRRIDAGRIKLGAKRRLFTVACGIGYDAEVMGATDASQKLRWGKAAYLANALGQTGSLRCVPHVITIDGVRHAMDATQVVVANFGQMLPVIEPRRRIRGDDGRLDVIVIRASGPIPALLAGWEALLQKDLGESASGRVFRARARKVRVETDPARIVETDGSVVGRTPVTASIRPLALTVIVPRR
jgi:diacylglycerol kinase (ATP)